MECLQGSISSLITDLFRSIRLYPAEYERGGLRPQAKAGKENTTLEQIERSALSKLNDTTTTGIFYLTQTLVNAEDHYRLLGSKYYSHSWIAISLSGEFVETVNADSYSVVVSALHGREQNRPFLQPWRELERRMNRSASLLAANEAHEAYRECMKAFARAREVSRSLVHLQRCLDELAPFNRISIIGWDNGEDENLIWRDTAM